MKFIVIVILIFITLICLDKGLTLMNLTQIQKNFPNAIESNDYSAEKNPLARWFFQKYGLIWGTLLYAFVSLVTLLVTYFILSRIIPERIALYIIMMIYGLVIMNNLYFLLKYSKIIA